MTFAYLCCMSSNSVTMPSKLLPISTEHGDMDRCQYQQSTQRCLSMADSLNMTEVKDLPKRVEGLREFGIWPVPINFGMF